MPNSLRQIKAARRQASDDACAAGPQCRCKELRRTAVALKKIRLEMARDTDFPEGSNEHGYEFVAPVDGAGLLDAEEWKAHRAECQATRFWADEDSESGHLVRKPGGHWAFHYDIHGNVDDDESGYRFGAHRFIVGEYVSIREQDDRLRTFRVVKVEDVISLAA
jgi:hypothetical protein